MEKKSNGNTRSKKDNTKMKYLLVRLISRFKISLLYSSVDSIQLRKTISEFEGKSTEIPQTETKRKTKFRITKQNIHELWDNITQSNIGVLGVSEGEGRENAAKEIMV